MEIILASGIKILTGMSHFAMLLIGLVLAKYFFGLTTPFKFNLELTEKDNPAFGVGLAGYLLGSGIALSGAIYQSGVSLTEDAIAVSIIVLTTLILMRLSVIINDWAILHSFSINKELIEDRNVGTGFVVAGSSIATGWMLNGVFSGHSETLLIGIRDIAVYWALGQVILIIGGFLFQLITRYDIHKVIGDEDNMPAGISLCGFLVALGIITRSALVGATSQLGEEILVTSIFAIAGLIILVLTRVIVDKVFLPSSPLSKEVAVDRNPAAGAIAAVSFIVIAVIFTAAVNPH
ncbi:MAG: DUF350 domain-containing protein [Candidatus Hatepunaea meridiana]|nr:DUF350 domain-containing protein [Candidatus Hatepunaea meridiana]